MNLPGFLGRLWEGWDGWAHKARVMCFATYNQSNPSRGNTQSCALRLSCLLSFSGCGDCFAKPSVGSAFGVKVRCQYPSISAFNLEHSAHTFRHFLRFKMCGHKWSAYTDESRAAATEAFKKMSSTDLEMRLQHIAWDNKS